MRQATHKNLSVPLPVALIKKLKDGAKADKTLLRWYVRRLLEHAVGDEAIHRAPEGL